MIAFPVGSDAVFSVPFLNSAGAPVTPTGASYAAFDGQGDPITSLLPVADLSGPYAEITIPAARHEAPGGYTMVLTIEVGSQTFITETVYGVFAMARLSVLKNSFQTYAQAVYGSMDIPNVASFKNAGAPDKIAAMIEAFARITRLNFVIPWPEVMDLQNRIAPDWECALNPRMWPLMTPDLYATYPDVFRAALNKAQIIEANDILTVDGYADRRRAGLMSESIGESSMMFKGGVRPLDLGCARATYEALTGFLNNRTTLTRS